MGGSKDKAEAALIVDRIPLTVNQTNILYKTSGYAQTHVNLIPGNGIRKGWRLDGLTEEEQQKIEEENRRLQVLPKLHEAWMWGRLHGASIVLMVTEEEGDEKRQNLAEKLRSPLDLSKVKKLVALQVFDRQEATPIANEDDLTSPRYRLPKLWQLSPSIGGIGGVVHHSRLLHFRGAKLPPSELVRHNGYDLSELEAPFTAIRNRTTVDQGAAILAHEFKISVLKIRGLDELSTSKQAEVFDLRMDQIARSRSMIGTMLLNEGEEFSHTAVPVTGFEHLDENSIAQLSAATGLPRTVFFGEPPGGLNTDGESHQKLMSAKVGQHQTLILQPCLEQLYPVIFAQKDGPFGGNAPRRWSVVFQPLEDQTLKEGAELEQTEAETALTEAQTLQLEQEMGVRGDGAVNTPFPYTIEFNPGQSRHGAAAPLTCYYGEIPYTVGNDGMCVDALVVPSEDPHPYIYVIHQNYPEGGYDEDKLVYGVASAEEAVLCYCENYGDRARIGGVSVWPVDDLVKFLADGGAVFGRRLTYPPTDTHADAETDGVPVPSEVISACRRSNKQGIPYRIRSWATRLVSGQISVSLLRRLALYFATTARHRYNAGHLRGTQLYPSLGAKSYEALGGPVTARWVRQAIGATRRFRIDAIDPENPRLEQSKYERPPLAYVQDLADNHRKIWESGGNIRGNDAFSLWKRYSEGDRAPVVLDWVREREAWAARHFEDGGQFTGANPESPTLSNIAGVVAWLKWGVVGQLGMEKIRELITTLKAKLEEENKG